MKTYKIIKSVEGYPSKNSTYEKELSIEEAKLALSGHKRILKNHVIEESENEFSIENEFGTKTIYSIEEN